MNLPTISRASIAAAPLVGVAALALAAGVAFAQPPAGGGGRGAGVRQACSADIQKFCASLQPGPDLRACIRKNFASLSDPCKSALEQMRAMRQQQSQGGGATQ